MFIRFLGENDKIAICAFLVLLTMPIWAPIALLIQGLEDAKLWVLKNEITIYVILCVVIGLVIIGSAIITLMSYRKEAVFGRKLLLVAIPSVFSIIATYNLICFINIRGNMASTEDGFFGLIEFFVWLLASIIAFLVVVVLHVVAVVGSIMEDSHEKKEGVMEHIGPFLFSFLPLAEIILAIILN